MEDLKDVKCEACRKDSPGVTGTERTEWIRQIPDWEIINVEGEDRLQRLFKFKDFGGALEFTIQVGALAEAQDHHPALLTEYGKVTVTWWTHKIKGLHKNDFVMAALTDTVYKGPGV